MYDIQWAPTKLVHMTLGYTSVLCTSLVDFNDDVIEGDNIIDRFENNEMFDRMMDSSDN